MRNAKQRIRVASGLCLWLMSGLAIGQDAWTESYSSESTGQYDAAIVALAPILEAQPDHQFALLRTAWLEYLDGDLNASIRSYRLAIDLDENSLDAQLGITLPLLAQRRWREAAAASEAVLAIAPWNYYAHVRLMVAEEGLRQWQRLASHAREVFARYPTDATILVYLARAEARQGNVEAALSAYSAVLERAPSHEEAGSFIARNSN